MTTTTAISAETLETLRSIPTQTLIDGLWVMGWPMSFIHGAKPLQPGQHMAGRAVTLRFVPHRPDLAADKPKGADSAEYVAFELCGPENVLVIDAMGLGIQLHRRRHQVHAPDAAQGGRAGHRRRSARQQRAEGVRLPGLCRQPDGQAGPRRVLALAGQRRHPVRRRPDPPRRRHRGRRRRRVWWFRRGQWTR